jgi:hypothetical protein
MRATPRTGIGQSGEFMKVPQEVWTNINRFVFLVARDVNSAPGGHEYARRHAVVASWPEVYAAAQMWSVYTFPALQQLATFLVEDQDLINGLLGDMLKAAEAVARGQVEKRRIFDRFAKLLEIKMKLYFDTAEGIMQEMERLDQAGRAVKEGILRAQTHDFALLDIEIKAEHASAALGASMEAWRGLQSDVTELRRVVSAAEQVDPDWYGRVGIKRWAEIARDAKGLVTDLKAQQRYLEGAQ